MIGMRFIIAYFTVFILAIFSVSGIEYLLFGNLTAQLIFTAILFAAPLVLVGATAAEIYYGFSSKASLASFWLFGFLYGLASTIIIAGILQLNSFILIAFLGAFIGGILAQLFYGLRGGKEKSGRGSASK